ncbi:Platelet-activating factor acetylhydrolase [Apophysomyces sp. BC1021]|nr:Platelet-activating factor acetylhydrolase [Apophysomyces sp. BC1021]
MSFLADFPALTGPFPVGCHDVEWGPKQKPDRSVLFRLYYPAAVTQRDQQAFWISHKEYARALCEIARLPSFLVEWLSSQAARKRIRAYADAAVLKSTKAYPIIIFSHGLGGNRHVYSSFCQDMASHGFVVAAIEHRDKSGSLAKLDDGKWVRYADLPPEVWDFRHQQLRFRVDEVNRCVHALKLLSHGKLERGFEGLLDLKSLVIAGHSFGGATSVKTCFHIAPSLY